MSSFVSGLLFEKDQVMSWLGEGVPNDNAIHQIAVEECIVNDKNPIGWAAMSNK